MSLAHVAVSQSEFDVIHRHLVGHKAGYRCMHLREARQRNKKRDLRYLHAMHATVGRPDEIEGVISGLGVVWHYTIVKTRLRTQLNVLRESAASPDLDRLGRRFLHEIMERVNQEQTGTSDFYPVRSPGQFYLRRSNPGVPATHPTCVKAVGLGVLDPLFVSKLASWNLALLCP